MLSGGETLIGEIIGLASALCWATATIINKRANLPFGPWGLSFWQMLIGSIAVLGLAYGTVEQWPTAVTREQWGWFFWLAIPASTGSFGLWFVRSEEHTSELQSLIRISYAVFCLKKKKHTYAETH